MTENIYKGLNYESGAGRKGFTLIELLVVVAIIAILGSILFPVFGRARENARRSSCISNLKQLGLAVSQYSQDYDERLPNGSVTGTVTGTWLDHPNTPSSPSNSSLYTYVKNEQVYTCLSDTKGRENRLSYAINMCVTTSTDSDHYYGKP